MRKLELGNDPEPLKTLGAQPTFLDEAQRIALEKGELRGLSGEQRNGLARVLNHNRPSLSDAELVVLMVSRSILAMELKHNILTPTTPQLHYIDIQST